MSPEKKDILARIALAGALKYVYQQNNQEPSQEALGCLVKLNNALNKAYDAFDPKSKKLTKKQKKMEAAATAEICKTIVDFDKIAFGRPKHIQTYCNFAMAILSDKINELMARARTIQKPFERARLRMKAAVLLTLETEILRFYHHLCKEEKIYPGCVWAASEAAEKWEEMRSV